MNEQATAQGNKFECLECRNEVELKPENKAGDVIECPLCGIEYEIVSREGESAVLQMIEEEK